MPASSSDLPFARSSLAWLSDSSCTRSDGQPTGRFVAFDDGFHARLGLVAIDELPEHSPPRGVFHGFAPLHLYDSTRYWPAFEFIRDLQAVVHDHVAR